MQISIIYFSNKVKFPYLLQCWICWMPFFYAYYGYLLQLTMHPCRLCHYSYNKGDVQLHRFQWFEYILIATLWFFSPNFFITLFGPQDKLGWWLIKHHFYASCETRWHRRAILVIFFFFGLSLIFNLFGFGLEKNNRNLKLGKE